MTMPLRAVLLCIAFVSIRPVAAYEIATHEELSVEAAAISTMDLALRALGLRDGLQERIQGVRASSWVGVGGGSEDDWLSDGFLLRSVNHFHNPLLDWTEAGLLQSHASSILWQQSETQSWSWPRVRQHYKNAWSAASPIARERALADMLRGLGHVIHLVQDAASPAHTRNDGHVFYNYEGLVDRIRASDEVGFRQMFVTPWTPNVSWRQQEGQAAAPRPIARLIDRDKYVKTSPDPAITMSSAIGLAEYTQANFFSEDTVFPKASAGLPYPNALSATEEMQTITLETGEVVERRYWRKTAHGATGYLLATVGLLRNHFAQQGLDPDVTRERPALDDRVYEDYARELLPRAVGYSAALLDYFFRGRLAGELEVVGDPAAGPYTLVLHVGNATPGELMNGRFTVYYDRADGSRVPVATWTQKLATGKTAARDLGPLPELRPSAPLIVVFEGTLGKETQAVVVAHLGSPGYSAFLDQTRRSDGSILSDTASVATFAELGYPAPAGETALSLGEMHARYADTSQRFQDTFLVGTFAPPLVGPARFTFEGGCFQGPHAPFEELGITLNVPVAGRLVRYVEPATLQQLYQYRHGTRPELHSVLHEFALSYPIRTDQLVDIAGAGALGLQLMSQPPTPLPATGGAWCKAHAYLYLPGVLP